MMNDTNPKMQRHRYFLPIVCWGCALSLVLGGCAPLKKKFTRKRTKDLDRSREFIPVLEPIDYPQKAYSSKERYSYHYSLWKIWDRDFAQAAERDDSDKRQKYLLAQALAQLGEMNKWLEGGKQDELSGLIEALRVIESEFDKSPSMRNKFSLLKRVELNAKEIRKGFSPKLFLPYRE